MLRAHAVMITCLGVLASGATFPARAESDVGFGPVQAVNILEGRVPDEDSAAIRVLEATPDGLRLEFELPVLRTQAVTLGGTTYHALDIEGGGECGADGEPLLPTFSRFIQIPDRAGVTIEVISKETTTIAGILPLPAQPGDGTDFVKNESVYTLSDFGASSDAAVGAPALARDLRLVPITFNPVRCDLAAGSIEVAGRIEVRVIFAGEDQRNVRTGHDRIVPQSFDRIYRNTVVNYDGPRDDQTVGHGGYVIICPDDIFVVAALQPLVDWRTRKGLDVTLATTAETGSSAGQIRAWLQDAYNNWDNPPEYIVIVGDTDGGVAIPYFGAPGGGETDHDYCQLDGDDILADAHVGRISVTSVSEVEDYVAKITGYESTPYMGQTDWYRGACLVGDPSSSGPSTIHVMQWLKVRLLEWGYTGIDTVFAGPYTTQMRTSLNDGVGVFGYRGYWGMSGWDTGDIEQLTNDYMLPYCVNLTCGTGSFASGYAISEAWPRATDGDGNPIGGVASIGTATLSTHTRYNNCATYGIWRSIYWEDEFEFGPSLTRGKYELYLNYQVADPGGCSNFTHWNNLMGDPGGELWTDVPQPMTAQHESEISVGANVVRVLVEDGVGAVGGALVHVWIEGELSSAAYTGADGYADVPFNASSTGTAHITVTLHDHRPYLTSVPVVNPDKFVTYNAHTIDDDGSGSSSGNSNGQVNPLEQIELPVQVRNLGTQSATDVTGTIQTTDPYVTILDASESFGTVEGGGTAWSSDDFDIAIAAGAPNGHQISLGLTTQSGTDSWYSVIELTVVAAAFDFVGFGTEGFGAQIDPGESGTMYVSVYNSGNANGQAVTGNLVSGSSWVDVTDPSGTYGTVGMWMMASNSADPFAISVAPECANGHIAPMTLFLEFSGGVQDTVEFVLNVGEVSSTDPTGPCAYGYYAFDDTDTGYPDAPTYNWVEIASNHGGPGTALDLNDTAFGSDNTKTMDLPFEFTYYGEAFTRVSICSNGWMAMGSTWLVNYRNWLIPAIGAPPYLISPMWDNFYESGQDEVYTWFDSNTHRFVVQWSRMLNTQGGNMSNFQAILYDPAYHATDTGDGIIEFQYDTFSNSDYLQHYSTIGIQNGDNTTGVSYGYFNYYEPGAASIQSGRAIRFMPVATVPRGVLSGTVHNATNGGTVSGAQVELLGTGQSLFTGEDGTYSGPVTTGVYTVVAGHAGFTSDTTYNVPIVAGETSSRDFTLTDIEAPIFSGTTDHGNTIDTEGPYVIETTVAEDSGFSTLSLFYRTMFEDWTEVVLVAQGGDVYQGEIPGQAPNTGVDYYLYGEDVGGNASFDPPGAPGETYFFWVLHALIDDNVEAGTGDWTHYEVTGGFVDQWHRSSLRNHTEGGSWSWMFGDPDSLKYSNLSDGALATGSIELDGEATLTFWHWMDAEVSGAYPGYAYDGGMLEMSIDGGAWTQVTPDGGYPYLIREGSQPGPFPPETPVFSGSHDWQMETLTLTGITGTTQLRFRFGSDGSVVGEGWFIDDVALIGGEPGYSDAEEIELLPTRVLLHQNSPNPFRGADRATMIRFELPVVTPVKLQVFDVSGRLVRTLSDQTFEPGPHSLEWDGRDGRGARVDSGVYFYVLSTDRKELARQMLLMK